MAQLTPEQAQAAALKAIEDIDDVEMKNPKLRGGTYPELEIKAIRAGIDGKFRTPFYAFEFIVRKNDGLPTSNPVDSVAAYVINIAGAYPDIRKGVLRALMNAAAGREVSGKEYEGLIKNDELVGNVISFVGVDTKAQTSQQHYVKMEAAFFVRKKSTAPAQTAPTVVGTPPPFTL